MSDLALMFDRELGSLVRLHRIASGISQQDLAEQIGLTLEQVSHYEDGNNRLSVFRFWEIMSILRQEPSRVLAQLTERMTFANVGAAVVERQGLDFMATNRGRQIINALAMCDQPEVLDVMADLILSVGVHSQARGNASKTETTDTTSETRKTS